MQFSFFVSSVIRFPQLMGPSSAFQVQYIVPKKVRKKQWAMISNYKQVGHSIRAYIVFVNMLQHKLRALRFFEMLEKRRTTADWCCNPQSPEMCQAFNKCNPWPKEAILISQMSREKKAIKKKKLHSCQLRKNKWTSRVNYFLLITECNVHVLISDAQRET